MGLRMIEKYQTFQASLRNSLLHTFVFPAAFFHSGFVCIIYPASGCPVRCYVRSPLLRCFHKISMFRQIFAQLIDNSFLLRTQFSTMLSAATFEILRFPCTVLSRTSLNRESIGYVCILLVG